MKYNDIMKKFTDKIAEYINKGYILDCKNMRSLGGREEAKLDLTNGKETIRVYLESDSKCDYDDEDKYSFFSCHYLILTVGKIPTSFIWTNLEVISREEFYLIGGKDFYGSEEDARKAQRKSIERYYARNVDKTKRFSEEAKKVVLPFVRRQPKCKTVKLSDITKVVREDNRRWDNMRSNYGYGNSEYGYFVYAKGNKYKIA